MKLIRLPARLLFWVAFVLLSASMALMQACAWLVGFLGCCAGYAPPKKEEPCSPPR